MTMGRDVCYDVRDLARSLSRSGILVRMFHTELGEEGYLEDEGQWGRDGGGHDKKQTFLV